MLMKFSLPRSYLFLFNVKLARVGEITKKKIEKEMLLSMISVMVSLIIIKKMRKLEKMGLSMLLLDFYLTIMQKDLLEKVLG